MDNDSHMTLNFLLKVLNFASGNIFITDKNGKIIYVNMHCANSFGMEVDEVMGCYVRELIDKKIIDRSLSLEVMEKRSPVVGSVRTRSGDELYSICNPVFDDNGELEYVITCGQTKGIMEQYLESIEEERRSFETYKTVIAYYNEKNNSGRIIIQSEAIKNLFAALESSIKTDSTIILYGESGVGKDVVAKYIHSNGPRRNEPFIPINCAAIPSSLMESEFFGYEKGAFTGASHKGKLGLFELSNKGTLFLDEVADLPGDMQTKLLRVIESREITRLGGTSALNIDIRLIAATNKDLRNMVRKGLFREDLFYRLNVLPFSIPPLRERVEDIEPLANYFLDELNKKYSLRRRFANSLITLFQKMEWKGNIRELKNIVERMVITSQANILTVAHFHNMNKAMDPGYASESSGRPAAPKKRSSSLNERFHSILKEEILNAMLKLKGNRKAVAKHLGISRGKLYRILNAEETEAHKSRD